MAIRLYRSGDRGAVERLLREGLRAQAVLASRLEPPEDAGFFASEWAEHLRGLDAEPAGWIVAGGPSGAVRGALWLRVEQDAPGPYASVRQIVVDADHRGQGIGSALLRAAEGRVRETDAVMFLISGFANNPALRLYRRLGFDDLPARFRKDPNPNHVVLWKDLAGVGAST